MTERSTFRHTSHHRRHRQDRHARSWSLPDGPLDPTSFRRNSSRWTVSALHRLQPVQDAVALGIKHTAPYFHDNSSKTLEEVAEQYAFMFRTFAGINLTPQDEADIVAFLKLL